MATKMMKKEMMKDEKKEGFHKMPNGKMMKDSAMKKPVKAMEKKKSGY